MSKALKKLTIAYLRLQERANKLQAENEKLRAYALKADGIQPETIKPVILLRTLAGYDAGGWITERIIKTNGDTVFGTNSQAEHAKRFANLEEVSVFLGKDYPLELVSITFHHPKTLQPVNVVSIKTE